MFNFAGYFREEEERPVEGMDWSSSDAACDATTNPCAGMPALSSNEETVQPSWRNLPSRRQERGAPKRIDMAAVISQEKTVQAHGNLEDLEATEIVDIRDWSADSDDLKTEDSDDRKLYCGVFLCTPCLCRSWLIALFLFALFLLGLGVGLAVRDDTSRGQQTFAAAESQTEMDTTITPSQAPQLPLDESLEESSSPSAFPTIYFEFDFDYEAEIEILPEPEPENEIVPENEVEVEVEPDNIFVGEEESETQWDNSNSPFLVGVYYYPWHGNDFHNGDGYLRRDLVPKQQPTLGEYDDSRPETIARHLQWSRQANIGLWITSWWGPNRLEDTNTKDVIMEHPDLGDLKVALHYETVNRVRGGLLGINNDMQYMCENYFDHPNYYKVNGRPVIFVYVTRKLEVDGNLESVILTMRTAASRCGHDVYLVGDHVFADAPVEEQEFVPFLYFDAVTNYDVYGAMGRPSPHAGRAAVEKYYSDQQQWQAQAAESGCRYIPATSPGYNDRSVRYSRNHPPLSRKLTETAPEGSLFSYQLSIAKTLVDPEVDNLLVVNSFNEWHEDTQIEPTVGERTNSPFNLTQGVYYEGYGDLYLNILRQWTIN